MTGRQFGESTLSSSGPEACSLGRLTRTLWNHQPMCSESPLDMVLPDAKAPNAWILFLRANSAKEAHQPHSKVPGTSGSGLQGEAKNIVNRSPALENFLTSIKSPAPAAGNSRLRDPAAAASPITAITGRHCVPLSTAFLW